MPPRVLASGQNPAGAIILYTFFTRIRGGDYNASSGFGLWAKTLRGQLQYT